MTKSTDQAFDIAAAMKMAQWERCKGELRALGAMQGSYHSSTLPGQEPSAQFVRMERATAAIEAFISDFSDEGFGE